MKGGLLALPLLWVLTAGCGPPPVPDAGPGDGDGDHTGDGDGDAPGDGDGDGDGGVADGGLLDAGVDAGPEEPVTCDDGDDAFVRRATLAVLGRRPRSDAEVAAGAAFLVAAREALGSVDPEAEGWPARRVFVEGLASDPAYLERWSDVVMDLLHVPRVDERTMGTCYGSFFRGPDEGALAAAIAERRPGDPTGEAPALSDPFTLGDVLRSSLLKDDLSVPWRTHLFALVAFPASCGNVSQVEQELARRQDIGTTFDATYLGRDLVCLGCHNSEFSVTESPLPEENRHFPLPGAFESALFGISTGALAEQAHAMLRVDGFSAMPVGTAVPTCGAGGPNSCAGSCGGGAPSGMCFCDDICMQMGDCCADYQEICVAGQTPLCDGQGQPLPCEGGGMPTCGDAGSTLLCIRADEAPVCAPQGFGDNPWGLSTVCGFFGDPRDIGDDPAGVEVAFGELSGLRTTVYDVESMLRRGVNGLADDGLDVDGQGHATDPDEALAYLVAATAAEGIWREVVGTPLTIPTRFPRSAAARDELFRLTDGFARSRFSLKKLLADVLTGPYANLKPPSEACSDPYGLPRIFDPWTLTEPDEAARMNSAADQVVPLSARTLLSAAYVGLDWPRPAYARFPHRTLTDADFDEQAFQRNVGVFHRAAEKGFRGLDFQARLAWEERFGACRKPEGMTEPDAIDVLVEEALSAASDRRTLVRAVKARLLGSSALELDEEAALELLLGAARGEGPVSLDEVVPAEDEAQLEARALCGAILSSPWFLLSGVELETATDTTMVTLGPDAAAACAELTARSFPGLAVSCDDDGQPLAVVAESP